MPPTEQEQQPAAPLRAFLKRRWQYLSAAAFLILLVPFYILFVPANGFPKGQIISIPADASSKQIGAQLVAQHVIRSTFQFKAYARISGQERQLQSGIYVFNSTLGLAGVVHRLATGEHGIQQVRVTLTEGMTAKDMAQTVATAVPGFSAQAFIRVASTSEGYLFPDTYFMLPGTTPEEFVQRLRTQFDQKIATIQPQITAFGKPLRDDIIIASILEREVKDPKDKQIVAGILYNRLSAGMPLQVDAAFGYAHGVNGYTPTAADLASNSPYNTYRFTGLPPTPISNPGLDSILAAVTPANTSYFYYLTGADGTTHYAKTFEQHKTNIAKYLK